MWAAIGNGNKGTGKGKGKDSAGTNYADETEDNADHRDKNESEHWSERTADGAWCFGSMNALDSAIRRNKLGSVFASKGVGLHFWQSQTTVVPLTLPRTRAGSKGTR